MGNGEKCTSRHISPADPYHVTTVACPTQLQGFVPARMLTDKGCSIPRLPFQKKRSIGNHRGNCYNLIYVGEKKSRTKDEKEENGGCKTQR